MSRKLRFLMIAHKQMLDAVLASITRTMGRGDKVDLRGFGSFEISEKKERQGRNPRTGETMTIPARKAAVFKSGRELAERVNTTGVVVETRAGRPGGV